MKTSNKLRKQLLSAINAATMSLCNEHVPACLEGPPELWPDDQKRVWDLLNELDHRACRNVDALLQGVAFERLTYNPHRRD